ncbi:LytR C-terminal domain-containing protein [Streptomyces sp. NPDC050504]|uniref:LCP family protein n=1 Tax=Streptomyces sp. NPDC050504 TaxID=3365618 RepID=UPI0037885E51
MNDQQNPYDPYELVGYDEYGQPVYQYAQQQQPQQQQQAYGYDPYAQQQPQQNAAPYDPYAQQQYGQQAQQQAQPQAQPQQQTYGYGYDTTGTGRQPAAVDSTAQWAAPQPPQQSVQAAPQPPGAPRTAPEPPQDPVVPGQRRAEQRDGRAGSDDAEYRTEQFSFIEEPDEDSEDVIDWLKFTESRSERREEAKRRTHNRIVALVVVAVLAVVGGVGYLWFAGKLPGLSDGKGDKGATATGPQHRDVIALHLHATGKGGTSTVLLVDNTTTKQGTTVLLPNSLSVADEDGTATTLAKSVEEDGSTGTRESLSTLLSAKITGTWRLDTPYLENLVEQVGGIDVDTDATVPGAKKGAAPLVTKGEAQTLNGQAAVAYSTYRGPGEPEAAQLQRFGQVVQAVLRKLPDDAQGATVVVQTLAQVLDPSLPEKDLGAFLAKLAARAKGGAYKTTLLPAQPDGTLGEQAADSVVKDILGGSVKAPEQGETVRVGVRNATGDKSVADAARTTLVNGGYTVIDGGGADGAEESRVTYGDAAQKPKAVEVAKTLGLKESAVKQGKAAANADVSVVLGRDYKAK